MSDKFIYGVNPVMECLRAERPVERLYLLRGRRDQRVDELIRMAEAAGTAIRYEPREQLDRITGTTKHQGVAAIVGMQGYLTLDQFLDRLKSAGQKAPYLVMLDEVEDPHNLGAIIRTAEASGAAGVLIPERRAAGLTPAVIKASAGAAAHLPVIRVGNLVQAMETLKAANFWIIGLDAESTDLYTAVDWTSSSVIVAGSEGKGLRQLVRQKCDQIVSIPLKGSVSSLNVSVATAIVLYEVVRQRNAQGRTR